MTSITTQTIFHVKFVDPFRQSLTLLHMPSRSTVLVELKQVRIARTPSGHVRRGNGAGGVSHDFGDSG